MEDSPTPDEQGATLADLFAALRQASILMHNADAALANAKRRWIAEHTEEVAIFESVVAFIQEANANFSTAVEKLVAEHPEDVATMRKVLDNLSDPDFPPVAPPPR